MPVTRSQTRSQQSKKPSAPFEDWCYEPYITMEKPVKSFCLDMIAHSKATGDVNMWFGGLCSLLDATKLFTRYRNWEAFYGQCFYRIPLDKWIERTGLTLEETTAVGECIYMGALYTDEEHKGKKVVTIYGDE